MGRRGLRAALAHRWRRCGPSGRRSSTRLRVSAAGWVMSSFARHDSSIIPDGCARASREMRSARDSRECRHAVALRAWEVRPWHRAWRVGVGLRRGQCFRGVSGCLQPCVTRGGRARWTSAALSYDASAILRVAVGRLARRRRPPFLRGAYGLLYRPPQTRRAKTQEAQQAAQTRDRTTNMQQRNLAAFTARGGSISGEHLTCRGTVQLLLYRH